MPKENFCSRKFLVSRPPEQRKPDGFAACRFIFFFNAGERDIRFFPVSSVKFLR
jgi:hypothetical protein